MAVLSKHGVIYECDRVLSKIAYCSDGKILRNNGDGWKLWRKVKPGIDPFQRAVEAKAEFEAKLVEMPGYRRYRTLMHQWGLQKRHLIVAGMDLLGNDLDGLWSELNDNLGEGSVTLEDLEELVAARGQMQAELAEWKKRKAQAEPVTV